MFSRVSGFALAAASAMAVETSDLAEVQCQAITTSSLTIFNINDIEATQFYEKAVGSTGEKLQFNYCTYGIIEDDAYALSVSGQTQTVIASDMIDSALGAENLRDENDKTIGVTFTQSSDTVCTGTTKYSMTTNLYCKKDLTTEGAATIKSVTKSSNGCEYIVNLEHAAGCPEVAIDIDQYIGWLADNQWCVGIIYLIVGPVLALFGLAWFPYVTASLVAVFVIGLCCSLSLAFGWMVSTTGTIVTLCVALVLGILAGCLIRRNIWIMIGLLGMIAGFFSGTFVYALIYSMSGWKAVWGFWVISVVMAVIGCVMSCYLGKSIVLLSTSMVGSYLFMRSWTLFFPGNWPSESEILDEDFELETGAVFWVFVGVFIISFIGSVIFQKKRDVTHEDLDNYQKA